MSDELISKKPNKSKQTPVLVPIEVEQEAEESAKAKQKEVRLRVDPIEIKPAENSKEADEIVVEAEVNTLQQFEKECLEAHNKLRRNHGCQDLILDEGLCIFAKEWAEDLANRDAMEHRPNLIYGESVYKARHGINGSTPVLFWYNEIKDFDFKYKTLNKITNNFTAIIWKDTKKLGVGVAETENFTYVVVNYSPPGNLLVPAAIRQNVPPPKSIGTKKMFPFGWLRK